MRELLRGRRRSAGRLRLGARELALPSLVLVACWLAGGWVSARSASDTPSFSVRITSPLGRLGVSGTVRIVAQVEAIETVVLEPIRFYVDGVLLGIDEDGPPYAVSWVDEDPFEPREIVVEVTDTFGATARDSIDLEPFEVREVSGITSILLEAAVYDKRGRFVPGLERSHFLLKEDGVPQPLQLVSQETMPVTFELLIDASQSLGRRLPYVRRAAERLSQYLRSDDRVIIAPFSTGLEAVTGPVADRRTIAEAIMSITTSRGTAIFDSLVELAERQVATDGRRVVVLLTDGYDEHSELTFEDALETLRAGEVTVYVVAIGGVAGVSLEGEDRLRQLAFETGGLAFFPPRERELEAAYDRLAADAQNRYLVGYTPINQEADGTWRGISLTTTASKDYVVKGTRTGYLAPAPPPVRPSVEFTVMDLDGRYVDVAVEDLVIVEDGVEQNVDTFHEAVSPVSLVLALDSSGSMRRSAASVVDAARSFVESLREEDGLAVMMFGDRPELAHDLTTERQPSFEAIESYRPVGGTALYDAVATAVRRLSAQEGRRAVVVLTDGRDEDNPGTGPGSRRSLEDVEVMLRRSGATVFTVGLGPNVAREPLERMAVLSGGQAYFPADVDGLSAEYARIVENLRRRFVLSYDSTNVTRDGAWRAVDIQAKSSSFVIASTGGYFAPEAEPEPEP